MYEYLARLDHVVDGDTLWLVVDLGFDTWVRKDFRMWGINAPEHGTPEGDAATRGLLYLIGRYGYSFDGERLFLARTHKDQAEKYGRILVDLWGWLDPDAGHGDPAKADLNLNLRMIDNGHAVPYFGGAR